MILPTILSEFLIGEDSLEFIWFKIFSNMDPMIFANKINIQIANKSITAKRSVPFSLNTFMKNSTVKISPAIKISGLILFFHTTWKNSFLSISFIGYNLFVPLTKSLLVHN